MHVGGRYLPPSPTQVTKELFAKNLGMLQLQLQLVVAAVVAVVALRVNGGRGRGNEMEGEREGGEELQNLGRILPGINR